jgi:hypothetical protein
MELSWTDVLLLIGLVFAWSFGALLQWWNIRRQEKVLEGLQRLRLRISSRAAREKAPRLQEVPQREERYTRVGFPLTHS